MNVNEIKLNHPVKGPLEIGRWKKEDLGKIILNQDKSYREIIELFRRYQLLYGFHDS
ncbi:hypothetical protein [Nitrososphaeria virus YSH_922147]|uniref:Uncharacterized protein n=1 Tax=Nitrososphaeria virus YSH_922147 TaxID=3071323 RepID=A0A976UAQ1_9CAUD|nr:hypothetical protein QKV94_gp20 [Yangshan Harbor Nitrososphaeria virus]UVF62429.1 hypothetical protein [Nitrososphaeria virus YSH_922147]